MKRCLRNLKHEIINLLLFIEDGEDIKHRFPRLELLNRGVKNFIESGKPLNAYEKIHEIQQGEKYVRFGRYTSIRSYKGKARKINNLIF